MTTPARSPGKYSPGRSGGERPAPGELAGRARDRRTPAPAARKAGPPGPATMLHPTGKPARMITQGHHTDPDRRPGSPTRAAGDRVGWADGRVQIVLICGSRLWPAAGAGGVRSGRDACCWLVQAEQQAIAGLVTAIVGLTGEVTQGRGELRGVLGGQP